MPSSSGETPPGQKKQNRGFAFVKFSSHAVSSFLCTCIGISFMNLCSISISRHHMIFDLPVPSQILQGKGSISWFWFSVPAAIYTCVIVDPKKTVKAGGIFWRNIKFHKLMPKLGLKISKIISKFPKLSQIFFRESPNCLVTSTTCIDIHQHPKNN